MCVRLFEFAEEVEQDKLKAWLKEYADIDYNVIQIFEATKQPLSLDSGLDNGGLDWAS
jgi:hypothetical protein